MSNEIAALEAEVKEYQLQLETVVSGLQADPENTELQNLQTELEEVINLTQTAITELTPTPARASKPSPTTDKKEKWSKESHPAYQAGYRKPSSDLPQADDLPAPPPSQITYSVNDNVLAKWVTGDHAFYPARITSITGSAAAPVYVVSFKSYATTEMLSAKDLKPVNDSRKRKADGAPAGVPPPPPSPPVDSGSNVISAAADINPDLAVQAKREPSKVSDGPVRPAKIPRKVKANKELEAGKNKWQDFAAKGKMGKGGKKDSMFRTPEGVNARVGFTGSGQAMRKDQTRSRHIYQPQGEEE
ncbi:MAG: hypothetical protein M1814_003244 [Vezdaea aestivalis]|nr:MAG: hypothetical protein M1814_003244 [Vezdaea aestivalis]